MRTIHRGGSKYVRLEEYSERYDLTGWDVVRVMADYHLLRASDVVIVSDTRPEDQNTSDGRVESMSCVSLYIPLEVAQ